MNNESAKGHLDDLNERCGSDSTVGSDSTIHYRTTVTQIDRYCVPGEIERRGEASPCIDDSSEREQWLHVANESLTNWMEENPF